MTLLFSLDNLFTGYEQLSYLIRKQPLRGVRKNRCSFFPGDIHNDANPCTALEQVYFPGGQQS